MSPRLPTPRRRFQRTLVALTAAAALSCSGDGGTAPEIVASVAVSPGATTLASRALLPLSASVRAADGKVLSTPITWTSSDTTIAKVSAVGIVTAGVVTGGTSAVVTIRATADGVEGTTQLTVLPVPVATVNATPPSGSLDVGGTLALSVALTDSLGVPLTGRAVTWTSSDTTVAVVSAAGVVTAVPYTGGATRTATITATSEGRSDGTAIQVAPIAVASVTVTADSVAVGDTRLLALEIRGAGGVLLTGRAVVWSSADSAVVVVNGAGLAIPAQYWGETTRTAEVTAVSGGITGRADVRVLPAPVGGITVVPGSTQLASGARDTIVGVPTSLGGVPLPGRTVSWQSSLPAILAVDGSGALQAGVVTGGAPVPVTITATSNGYSVGTTVSVLPSPVASVTLSADTVGLVPRATTTLQVTLRDAGGNPLTGRPVTWSSSDTTIVTVTQAGALAAPAYTGAGTREAYVRATSGALVDSARVIVRPNRVRSIALSVMSLNMPVGTSKNVITTLRDELGEVLVGRTLTWSSSAPGVASVNQDGVITMLGTGTARISVTVDSLTRDFPVAALTVALVPASIVAGSYHHCGLDASGNAYCWGYNFHGQLGDNTVIDSDRPVAVVGGLRFTSLTAGGEHTCGITVDHRSFCWGENSAGQLGDNSGNHQHTPQLVAGGIDFASLTAGSYHTCGLTADGTAYCWGRNDSGQIGDGTITFRMTPVPVVGGLTFRTLLTRHSHNCGIVTNGATYCWGKNNYGALGDGTRVRREAPTLMLGGYQFTLITVGWDHTCGLLANGSAHCLGRNQYGQDADGTFTERMEFHPVSNIASFTVFYHGFYGNCGVAASDGVLYCWGRNRVGELADGSLLDRNLPVAHEPGVTYSNVAQAYSHTCAMESTGVLVCWGLLRGGVGYSLLDPLEPQGMRRVAQGPRPVLAVRGR